MPTVINLAAVSEGRVGELITAQVPDPLTLAKGGTGATTAAAARTALGMGYATFAERAALRRAMALTRIERIVLELGGSPVTLAGSLHKNLWENGGLYMQVLSGTDGLGRFTPANSVSSTLPTLFPLSALTTLDWNKSWSLHLVMSNRVVNRASANDSGRFSVVVGKLETAGSAVGGSHPLTAKGLALKFLGKNGTTGAAEISVCGHNGTTENAGGLSTQVTNSFNIAHRYELLYLAGTGFYVYQGSTLVASITNAAHLPSGNSAAGDCQLSFLVENRVANNLVACTNFIQSATLFTEE